MDLRPPGTCVAPAGQAPAPVCQDHRHRHHHQARHEHGRQGAGAPRAGGGAILRDAAFGSRERPYEKEGEKPRWAGGEDRGLVPAARGDGVGARPVACGHEAARRPALAGGGSRLTPARLARNPSHPAERRGGQEAPHHFLHLT